MKRLLIASAVAGATLLLTAACGDDKAPAAEPTASSAAVPTSASPSASASGSAAAGKGLDYQTVAKLTGELFTKDALCPVGKWDANSTGVPSKYRSAVATSKQFDCFEKKTDMLPKRGRQAIFVEFTSADAAKAYAQDQAKASPVLLVGDTVLVAGTGLKNTDMKAYLAAVQETAGGTGKILP